jgi:uncharacterized protein (TIGR02246 family)
MNTLTKISLSLAPLLVVAAVAAGWHSGRPSPSDEDAIKARCDVFAAAWNKDDAAGMAACWSVDGDLINPFGRVAKGRTAVEQLFKDEHGGIMKGTHFDQKVSGVRFLASGAVAVVDWDITITNMKSPDGATLPAMPHHAVIVMQKTRDGTWFTEAARPYVFQTMPVAPKPAETR